MTNKKNNKTFWLIILCVAVLACIGCVGYIGWYMYTQTKADQEYENLRSEVTVTETESESKLTLEEIMAVEFDGWTDGDAPVLPEGVKSEEAEELASNPIDFAKLEEINSEIYAWIQIPDTNIDYPIAQHDGSDRYYLYYNMYHEPEFSGCIYSEAVNSKDFTDPNTVVYGHNMRNGSMFQNLHLFEDAEFFQENQYVYIYTPGHKLTYQVFAAYEYDDRHIINSFDFSKEEVFKTYIEDIFKKHSMNDNIRSDVEVTAEDKILTLSTCVGGKPNARYLVQAVLQNDEQTK